MAKELRIGIVGCGGVSGKHADAYRQAGNVQIACVYDVARKAAESRAAQTGAQVAKSVDQMAEDCGLDAVSICTPPAAHLDNCKPFLKRGVAILCEKPLEVNATTATKLARAARASRSVFMTAFCHRFHPPVIELKKLIKRGSLGEPLLFRNIFGGYGEVGKGHRGKPGVSGGGCLIDHGCHATDLYRHLVGDPTHVVAQTGNVMQKLRVEDLGTMLFAMGGKAFGEITAAYSLPVCGNWVEWYGTKGTAIISYWNSGHPDLVVKTARSDWKTIDCSKHPDRFIGEIKHFLTCARSGTQPSVTVDDGLKANRIADAVYESARTGKRVRPGL